MTTLGLPLFLEDSTGLTAGPTEFTDIYDRPPFLSVTSAFDARERKTVVSVGRDMDGRSRRRGRDGIKIVLEPGLVGTVQVGRGKEVELGQWLKRVERAKWVISRKLAGNVPLTRF